jgi:hypothetical protein
MRSRLLLSFALAAGSLTACDIPVEIIGPETCFMDRPCGANSYGGGTVVAQWIAGLPYDRVSTSSSDLLDLVPGDSATLYLVFGTNGPSVSSDTARAVAWAVTNGAVARITPGQGGSGALVAIAPGTFSITADGNATIMYACSLSRCNMISSIRVVAPPAPTLQPGNSP